MTATEPSERGPRRSPLRLHFRSNIGFADTMASTAGTPAGPWWCGTPPATSSSGSGPSLDIEDQRRLEERLRSVERQTAESLALLETLLSSAPVGFGFVDRDFRLMRANDALAATSGVPVEQQLGRKVAELIPELWPDLEPLYRRVLERGQSVVNLEASGRLSADSNREHTWLTNLYPVDLDDEVIGIGVVVVDITERKEAELKLKHLSEHDPLTGIYNRRKLLEELDRALRYTARYKRAGAMLTLDVDNFTWTNESSGHATGDVQLSSVAQIIAGRLRRDRRRRPDRGRRVRHRSARGG